MRLLVVNNTSAGFGDGGIYDYLRLVLSDGDEACVRCSDGTTDLSTLVADARNFDVVVVSGGDGTVASIAYHLAYTDVPVLPFPAGTANLLANNLLLPYEPHALAKITRNLQFLDFDLGEIESSGHTFGFGIMAGAGYDALIMHDAKPNKKLLGPIAYFQAAVTNVMPQKSHIKLVIDGKTVESEGLGILLVNFSRIQFEIPITHGTDARDGSLDIVILKAENAFGLIPALIAGVMDRDGSNPGRSDSMEIYRGSVVEAYADPPFHLEFDGELPGLMTPFTARVLNGASRFVLSDEGMAAFSD